MHEYFHAFRLSHKSQPRYFGQEIRVMEDSLDRRTGTTAINAKDKSTLGVYTERFIFLRNDRRARVHKTANLASIEDFWEKGRPAISSITWPFPSRQ
jgi:hypothetical protein